MSIRESITLYFCEAPSDKVYMAQINETPSGCTVTFAYGRRGSTMKDGSKTPVPVPYEKAKKIFDKLVGEKENKGYTPGKDGTPFSGSSTKERSGICCQLLNAVAEAEAMRLCLDPAYVAQEKIDGERRLLDRRNDVIRGVNRNGLYVVVTDPVQEAALRFAAGKFVIDGELVGDVLYAFDVLENQASGDLLHLPYRDRLELLQDMFEVGQGGNTIVLVPTAYTAADKLALIERVKANGGEGVVFKNLNADYSAGRPSSGGNALKFKFCETCSAVVGEISKSKRSVGLSVYDGESIVPIGNVTIPPNQAIPGVGDVVEIRYLYAFRGGKLFQPVYLGKRNDIDVSECTIAQLKFKQEMAA